MRDKIEENPLFLGFLYAILRKTLYLKQKDFAKLVNVSVKTVEHWESSGGEVKGAGAALLNILRERSWLLEEMEIPEKKMPLRLKYHHDDQLCTIVDLSLIHI